MFLISVNIHPLFSRQTTDPDYTCQQEFTLGLPIRLHWLRKSYIIYKSCLKIKNKIIRRYYNCRLEFCLTFLFQKFFKRCFLQDGCFGPMHWQMFESKDILQLFWWYPFNKASFENRLRENVNQNSTGNCPSYIIYLPSFQE